ncbi:hypothetical protein GB937_010755 [Aspergillus fischeri]|nr:hypothetical protein GB937_010755 [Aspergillus fischeri]
MVAHLAARVRYLAKRYWVAQKSIIDFVKEERLPGTRQVLTAIKYGHKVYLGELELKKPGIWLALMSVLKVTKMPLLQVYQIPRFPFT